MIHLIYIYLLVSAFLWGHMLGTSVRPRKVLLGTALLAIVWLISFPAAVYFVVRNRKKQKK